MEESKERDIKLDKMHELLKVMAVKLDKLDTIEEKAKSMNKNMKKVKNPLSTHMRKSMT